MPCQYGQKGKEVLKMKCCKISLQMKDQGRGGNQMAQVGWRDGRILGQREDIRKKCKKETQQPDSVGSLSIQAFILFQTRIFLTETLPNSNQTQTTITS